MKAFRPMHLSPPRALLVSISLVAALIALIPPQGWALCFEANGHVAIEPVCDGTNGGSNSPAEAGDDCGPCLDIQLAVAGDVQPTKTLKALVKDCAPAYVAPAGGLFDLAPTGPRSIPSTASRSEDPPPGSKRLILIL